MKFLFLRCVAQIFERIREVSPGQLKKIRLIKGDIAKEHLDIDQEDELELINNLDIVFHCAAKAKFSLTLRQALSFNTCGTLRVLQLAAKAKHLAVFSHVSTSYCFPQMSTLEERYYEPLDDPYRVIELLASKHKADLDDAEPR
jgi:alcohol-forming fatty acyl-CoA reductase